MIGKEEIQKLGHLARLNISDEEVESLTKDLNSILDYVSQIEKLDTSGVPITNNVLGMENVYRNDQVGESFPGEVLEGLAPEFTAGHFVVPRVIQKGE